MKFFVGITTYNRPALLTALLDQLVVAEHAGVRLAVCIVDDASTVCGQPGSADKFCRRPGWHAFRNQTRRGKRGFWQSYDDLLKAFRHSDADVFVSLPDDCRLSRDFFGGLEAIFDCDARPNVINFHRDDGERSRTGCWSSGPPTLLDAMPSHAGFNLLLEEVGWVDGFTAMRRLTVADLNFEVRPIVRAWDRNPLLGSGVGAQLTLRLRDLGLMVVRPRISLVRHLDGPSVMNAQARSQDPLATVHFIDDLVECSGGEP